MNAKDAPNYGAVSLWTRPLALHMCAGPKKIYPSFQLLRPTAGTGRCGITATSTQVDELHEDIDHMQLSLHTTGLQQPVLSSRAATVGAPMSPQTSDFQIQGAEEKYTPSPKESNLPVRLGQHSARCRNTRKTSYVHATATVLQVRTGQNAEHSGPANQRREHSARSNITINTSLDQATATVPQVHTGHDAGHHRPDDD